MNAQFSEEYAKLAESLLVTGETDVNTPLAAVLLFYDRHIALTIFDEEQYASVFLMSDQTVAPQVNEEYIPQALSGMGLTGAADVTIYEELPPL